MAAHLNVYAIQSNILEETEWYYINPWYGKLHWNMSNEATNILFVLEDSKVVCAPAWTY